MALWGGALSLGVWAEVAALGCPDRKGYSESSSGRPGLRTPPGCPLPACPLAYTGGSWGSAARVSDPEGHPKWLSSQLPSVPHKRWQPQPQRGSKLRPQHQSWWVSARNQDTVTLGSNFALPRSGLLHLNIYTTVSPLVPTQ